MPFYEGKIKTFSAHEDTYVRSNIIMNKMGLEELLTLSDVTAEDVVDRFEDRVINRRALWEAECDSCAQVFTSEVEPKSCINCGAQLPMSSGSASLESHQLKNGDIFTGDLNEPRQPMEVSVLSNEDESNKNRVPNAAGKMGAFIGTLAGWGPLTLPGIAGHEDAAVIALLFGALGCFFFGPALGVFLAEKVSAANNPPIFPQYFEYVMKFGGYLFLFGLFVSALLYLGK